MVPAESIKKEESRPFCLTRWVNTPSAAGLLHILPRHTNNTENGFLLVSDGVAAAIDDDMIMGFIIILFFWGL